MKKLNTKQSSAQMSTKAAKVLNNDNSSKIAKSLAGSVLAQAKPTTKKK